MLTDLRIRDLGVIAEADLEFGCGLNVLTGETGAGKTMVVTALGLLLGARADSDLVRQGARRAVVEGAFLVRADGAAAARAGDAGADLDPAGNDERELLTARSVAAAGRGRAHVGGRAVPVTTLAELADLLVSAHGQSEQILLRSPARQRQALDDSGGADLREAYTRYAQLYAAHSRVSRELSDLRGQATARRAEAGVLTDLLAQVESADPQPGEDHRLRTSAMRLENVEELARAATQAYEAVAGAEDPQTSPGAIGALESARRSLQPAVAHDEQLAEPAQRLAGLGVQLADLAADLASYRAGIDVDPAALATIQQRRADLAALVRRVPAAETVDDVLDWAKTASARLLDLDGDDARIGQLQDEQTGLAQQLAGAASELSGLRSAAADRLASAATAELTALAMPNAELSIEVRPAEPGPHGADEVSFLLRPHPGAPPRRIAKGASGGELSRVMLALEVCLASQADQVVTFVFDEVDAGVGGKAAVEIGRRLARLATCAQVLVVTHLPQVAAFADHHLVVRKSEDGAITSSAVRRVADADRVNELARMLAGQESSRSARAHAAELLELAAAGRGKLRQ